MSEGENFAAWSGDQPDPAWVEAEHMAVLDPLPPDDQHDPAWAKTGPPVVELDRFHLRCVVCGDVVGIKEAALDFGFSAAGKWIGLGYCLSCLSAEQLAWLDQRAERWAATYG